MKPTVTKSQLIAMLKDAPDEALIRLVVAKVDVVKALDASTSNPVDDVSLQISPTIAFLDTDGVSLVGQVN